VDARRYPGEYHCSRRRGQCEPQVLGAHTPTTPGRRSPGPTYHAFSFASRANTARAASALRSCHRPSATRISGASLTRTRPAASPYHPYPTAPADFPPGHPQYPPGRKALGGNPTGNPPEGIVREVPRPHSAPAPAGPRLAHCSLPRPQKSTACRYHFVALHRP